jgi:hypothetical protein
MADSEIGQKDEFIAGLSTRRNLARKRDSRIALLPDCGGAVPRAKVAGK